MYSVRLNNFEGPLDLLLFFIRRDELDIYDIPIASITQEFLEYVKVLELLDLELAGEFIVMASMLVQIKAQMLLPRDEKAGGDVGLLDEDDPRAELVKRLLEYKRYREASDSLTLSAENQRYVLYRSVFEAEEIHAAESGAYRNATLFDLLKALKRAVEKAPDQADPHVVTRFPITVEEKAAEIIHTLGTKPSVRFFELIGGLTKMHIVVTFLALLELAKNHRILVQQDERFDDIIIAIRVETDGEQRELEQEQTV
ncbi:MAG: segregation/condensation protein A [Ignavibacteria bacterium]|nr:segregation/condensation protein A [Ignavibacteria bacterium]MBP6510864.1 segregation/condensation protein A [Candidatus Kapabacteria bacterium]MBK6419010.1 segregation/condensation protein A [Ignavibacteria bacterium]MBK6760306.1 segregation/condensation protein A [Ignavibacteria bacterium]MBK7033952.1 segregation/condensation protein A [Ignavibacteria bacterium]